VSAPAAPSRRWAAPLLAALLGLAGSLGATLFLYRAAGRALEQVLDERLRGAGGTAALLLSGSAPDPARLRALMTAFPGYAVCISFAILIRLYAAPTMYDASSVRLSPR
jgi:hypothetical protein